MKTKGQDGVNFVSLAPDRNKTNLFVSFVGHRSGVMSQGWTVGECSPLETGADIEKLCRHLETARGYDEGSLVIVSFQRLELAK
jgi:hypothetical protein